MNTLFRIAYPLVVAATLAGCSSDVQRLQKYTARADAAFEAGRYKEAVVEYMNVIGLDRENARAYARLGQSHYHLDNKRDAFVVLSRALFLDPANVTARTQRANILFGAQQLDQVRKEAETILEKEPGHAEALLLWAHTNFKELELPAAEARIEAQLKKRPDDPMLLLARGTLRLRMKKLVEAEQDMTAAVKQSPEDFRPYIALGNLYLRLKRMDEAEAMIRKGAALSPPRSDQSLWGVVFHLQTGKVEAARAELEEILKRIPDFTSAQNLLSAILFGEQKFEQCAELVGKIIEKDPANFEALVLRARLHLARGDREKALEAFKRLAERFPYASRLHYEIAKIHAGSGEDTRAISRLDEASKLNPSDLDLRLFRSELFIRTGRHAEAVLDLKEIIEEQPRFRPAYPMLAKAYTARGTPADAVTLYEAFEKVFPDDPVGPYRKALVLQFLGRGAEARAAIEESLILAPEYLPALSVLTQLDANGDQAEATASRLQAVIDQVPDAPAPLLLQARFLIRQGKSAEAERVLMELLEQAPTTLGAYLLLAMIAEDYSQESPSFQKLEDLVKSKPDDIAIQLFYGLMLERTGDKNTAANQYESVLAVDPDAMVAANNLSYIYAEHLDKPDRAYELAEHARKLGPGHPQIADTLGWLCYKRGDYARALELLLESTEKLSQDPNVLRHLGIVHYTMNQPDEARQVFERALQSDEDGTFKGAADIRERLAILNATPPLDEATIKQCEKRVAASPPDLQALLRLAQHHLNQGRAEKALPLYQRAHQRNPHIVEPVLQLAILHIDHPSETKKGLEFARKAWALAPTDHELAGKLQHLAKKAGDETWAEELSRASGQ